jgi:hypothetical protein
MRKFVRNYWGWVVLIVLAYLWSRSAGPAPLIVLSAIVTLYFAFQAPIWCGAATRGRQMCRNNAYGVLMGCHLRQHRWQKLRMTVTPSSWRDLTAELWSDPKTALSSVGLILGIVSTLAGLLKPVITA